MSFKGLQRLNGTLRALADVPARASAAAASRIATLIDESFFAGLDPYGRPWAPLAASTLARRPWRGAPPLTDTGALRASVRVVPLPSAGISITMAAPGPFHQMGTRYMPQRQIFPQSGGIAPSWRAAIAQSITEAMRKAGA